MRIYLKRGVPWLSMVACLCYDMSLFLIFAVNITFHEDSELASTELSLLISCLFFGCLFEIVGRKKVFTMRLCVTSCCSFMVAFADKIWLPFDFLNFIREIPFQTMAFVMCSVSIAVPFIADFVKHKKRGLAYSYTASMLAFAILLIMSILNFDVDQKIEKEWFFGITSLLGLTSALSLCSFFEDKQDFQVHLRWSFFYNRMMRIFRSSIRNVRKDNSQIFIWLSMFVVNHVIFSIFFINYADVVEPATATDLFGPILALMLIPTLFYSGL